MDDLAEEISIFQNKITFTKSTVDNTEPLESVDLAAKLKTCRAEIRGLKKENDTLSESNSNHIFINEKLNKALKRCEARNEQLVAKVKLLTNESVILKKEARVSEPVEKDSPFLGDVSSICVKAD